MTNAPSEVKEWNETTFTGEVKTGEAFRRELLNGLYFELIPTAKVWRIRMFHGSRPDVDLVELVTPPFHVSNHLEIGESRELTARESAARNLRRFRFLFSPQQIEPAQLAAKDVTDPTKQASGSYKQAVALLGSIEAGTGEFYIQKSEFSKGESAQLQKVSFRVSLKWPKKVQVSKD